MLFKKPTVAELADEVTRLTDAGAPLIMEILSQLNDLTEEEVQTLLADECV